METVTMPMDRYDELIFIEKTRYSLEDKKTTYILNPIYEDERGAIERKILTSDEAVIELIDEIKSITGVSEHWENRFYEEMDAYRKIADENTILKTELLEIENANLERQLNPWYKRIFGL